MIEEDPRRWNVFLLSPGRDEAQQISFKNITFTIRHLAVGGWQLVAPRAWVPEELVEWGSGVIIEFNDESVFSGYVTRRKRERTSDQDLLTLSGKSDLGLVARRLASPDPSQPLDEPNQSRDVRNGPAGNLIAGYVNDNAGEGAIEDRKIPILSVDTPSEDVGSEVTGRARYNPLVEFCEVLAERAGDVSFSALQRLDSSTVTFSVRETRDLSEEIVFNDDCGTLQSFVYEVEEPDATYVVAGGRGEGDERLILTGENEPAKDEFGRIETFLDQRNAGEEEDEQSQIDELEDAIEDELKGAFGSNPKEWLEAKIMNTRGTRFMEHYRVGDIVSVELNDELVRVPQVVREAEVSIASNGVTVDLLVGNVSDRRTLEAFRELQVLNKKFSDAGRQ